MLHQIHIKNFVIVDELQLDFHSGFNVLTGETGAGKSIWVDAVMLALGARAETPVVRENEDHCSITLSFDLSDNYKAHQWLTEHDLENDNECIIRRIIKSDGKSKSSINGIPCSQAMIRTFSSRVLLTHGQHQHQALTQATRQRQQLDNFAQTQHHLRQCSLLYKQWHDTQQQILNLTSKSPYREDELTLWQFQLNEIEQLQLQPNEWKTLCDEHQQCHNASELIGHISGALNELRDTQSHNATDAIQKALQHLNQTTPSSKRVDEAKELITTADIHLSEACQTLQCYQEQLDTSPERLHYLENRIQAIHAIARKHKKNPEEIITIKDNLQHKIQELTHLDENLQSLKTQANSIRQQYQQQASTLSQARQTAAAKLSQQVSKMIQPLGMLKAQFKIQITPELDTVSPHGQDKIDFLVSTNAGQKLQLMSKTASGGELSRISLALQVAIAGKCHPPTMIFDEVDAGIGGKTADKVGELLQKLGQKNQILCITHLAQIAAKGCQHFKITKRIIKNKTVSEVNTLTPPQRIKEIARMIGSDDNSSLDLAKTMLTPPVSKKKNKTAVI